MTSGSQLHKSRTRDGEEGQRREKAYEFAIGLSQEYRVVGSISETGGTLYP